jgi:hypothetical protein
LKSAVLKNNITDASNMHERLSMALMRRIGVPASREAHARLFINGAYVGVYTLVESVDKDFLRRTFNENDGYLFEYEWAFPYYFTDRGTHPSAYVPSPFQPQTHEDDPKPEVLVELVQTVNSSANFFSDIATYLDLKKFLRLIAVETFLADSDDFLGDLGMANFYLYRFENKKLFAFIAWDKSEAFTSPLFSIWQHIRGMDRDHTNILVSRALESPELYDFYLDTLLECVRSINEPGATDPRGWMEREIDRIDAQVRDATFNDPVKPFANGQYDQALAAMREFAQRRGAFVTEEVNTSR